MQQITDLRVGGYVPLVVPNAMKAELPMTETAEKTVVLGRQGIEGILNSIRLDMQTTEHQNENQIDLEEQRMLLSFRNRVENNRGWA